MNTLTLFLLTLAFILSIFVPFTIYAKGIPSKNRFKKALFTNLSLLVMIILVAGIVMFGSAGNVALASETTSDGSLATGMAYIAAALSTGLACVGGGIAVASAAAAALGAISEDASIFGKSMIFLGLSEGFALYGLVISFIILGKV